MRAPYQVLVFPYCISENGTAEFAVFKRSDTGYWQAIAGGGEGNESCSETAKREAYEEAGISNSYNFLKLDSIASIPVYHFKSSEFWDRSIYVIPEYCFAVEIPNKKITLSNEHIEYRWVSFDEAEKLLFWDSNKTALWELNQRLLKKDLKL